MKPNQYLSHYIRLFLIQFLSSEKGLSENTILAYRDALKLLLKNCAQYLHMKIDQLRCDQIDDQIVRKFLDYLEQNRGCKPNTRNARLAALKTFFYYLAQQVPQCLDISQRISAIAQKKTAHTMVDYLDTDGFKLIMDRIDAAGRNGIRDMALLLLMHNTGARVQEIVDIKLDDLVLTQPVRSSLPERAKNSG